MAQIQSSFAIPALNLRQEIVDCDIEVPLLGGSTHSYVNLDNAASTPPFRRVKEKLNEAMTWYSSVHRGSGFKSLLSTQLYDQSREIVLKFVGADSDDTCIIFCKNASEALNHLANLFPFQPGDIVLTTGMEHHSNDLPWRARAEVIHSGLLPDGSLDLAEFQSHLEKNSGKIKLVAVTGASNVTGFMPPIYDLAELAHRHGAKIVVDCAQLLPHRKVEVGPVSSPRHLDFIAFSAHKVYAPFGSGGLVGEKQFFNQIEPADRGGGTVEIVTLNEVVWTGAPERDEAGSPNVLGAVALAASLKFLSEVGMDAIAAHEAELTTYALEKMAALPGIILYGSTDLDFVPNRVGVIPFQVSGVPHGKVAAILGFEGGIGVRNGCFCAHPYILHLLKVSDENYLQFHGRVLEKDRTGLPGLIRMSFGCYNNTADVDRLVEMLDRVVRGDYQGNYIEEKRSGSYYPSGFDHNSISDKYFQF
jgi:cysteine desulfurase / selenocysteine lyase